MICGYLDCFAGISGDMLLGSLINAGLPFAHLEEQLALLPLSGYSLSAKQLSIQGLACTKVHIELDHDQPHRHLADIAAIINDSGLADDIKANSLAVFEELAEAEARVHGVSPGQVHFHEVGAMDAILDIVGAAIGFHYFDIDRLVASALPMPHGFVECAHGKLPLPAPAVVELCQGLTIYGVDLQQEMVTPTGAAIIKALADETGPMPPLQLTARGYGSGNHLFEDGRPNLLRLLLGHQHEVAESQEVEVIDCHLDDWSPESFPWLSSKLFSARALDVSLIPIQMKKGRPGFLLRVLADPAQAQACKEIILSETTAIGLRFRREQRLTLPRQQVTITSRFGELTAKEVETPAGTRLYPEYEECCRLAKEHNVALQEVYDEVKRHG